MVRPDLMLAASVTPFGDRAHLGLLMGQILGDAQIQPIANTFFERAIESRYSRRFRPNEVQLALKRIGRYESLAGLRWLFDEHFTDVGGEVFAKHECREAYASLCARLHPAIVVGAYYAEEHDRSSDPDVVRYKRLRDSLELAATNFLPFPIGSKKWAELHVHLGGSAESSISLFTLALFGQPKKKPGRLPSLDFERQPEELIENWVATYKLLFRALLSRCLDQTHVFNLERLRLAWERGQGVIPPLSPKSYGYLNKEGSDVLPNLVGKALAYFEEGNSQYAWLYWMTALFVLYRREEEGGTTRVAIIAFLNLVQLLREDMIHDGVGLRRFMRYFGSTLRQAPEGNARTKDAVRQLLDCHPGQLAEIKVGPDQVSYQAIKEFIPLGVGALKNYSATSKQTAMKQFLKRWHLCVHFSRGDGQQNTQVPYKAERESIRKEVNRISTFLKTSRKLSHDGVKINPQNLLRGLDAAGDELAVPNEVFAPSMRWLRSLHDKLHISIHAGEDYDHLLGGMRHIDEAIVFADMKVGDRFGHALAVGVFPDEWIEAQPEVIVCLQDHLDNLVWAFDKAQSLSEPLDPLIQDALNRLQVRIGVFASLLYTDLTNLSPKALSDAWRLRKNCPIIWRKFEGAGTIPPSFSPWVPSFGMSPKLPEYLIYKQHLSRSKKRQEEIANQTVLLRQGDEAPFLDPVGGAHRDSISDADLRLMEALQDLMLKELNERGLRIEVNPSSNVYIGRIGRYHKHPIFRWCPPNNLLLGKGQKNNKFGLRVSPVAVVVSSDDPGIFPTNLANEFELLKQAAVANHPVSLSDAEKWIENLREAGVSLFESSHVDPISV